MELEREEEETDDRPILLIDSMNLFVRSFCAYPQMNASGEQAGGVIGFLKTLRKLAFEIKPKQIVCCWEGGGSSRRRALYSEYKQNRKPAKLNRFYEDDIPDSDENRLKQIQVLVSLLKDLPVCQIYVDDCEADDVIAYLCQKFHGKKKIIASSDKDFYQLIDDNTSLYSFHKKTYVEVKDVIDTYMIPPHNFALAKCLCGDPSDNVPGIKGLGFKTAFKRFPILAEEKSVLLEDIIQYASARTQDTPVYQRVVDGEEEIRRNWRLVYLGSSTLSPFQSTKVDHALSTCAQSRNKMAFIKKLVLEGINACLDVDEYFYSFSCIASN